ncbi:MAG TPA: divalent metal cation transporter, partial [Acidobacteriota bacterium]|nr:divalent metal cation transporter [Acidobacteriota bacterium]
AAIARPALYSKESIYRLMHQKVNKHLAIVWALAAIVTSIFWSTNQFAVAAACLSDIGLATNWFSTSQTAGVKWLFGLVIVVGSILLTWTYGKEKGTGIRFYEAVLKGMIGFMVICFAAVALKTGIAWDRLLAGLLPTSFPSESADQTMVLGALGCAVGINMTFLFPLSLQMRGWGKEHLNLARFDLVGGMLLPFSVISTLIIITCANVLHQMNVPPEGPAEVAQIMSPLFQDTFLPAVTGRVLFDLGIAAMPLSTITILMLISGLALCEILGVPHQSSWFKIGTMLPSVGVLGVAYSAPFWLGPLISSFALILLPIAYLGFLLLYNRTREGTETGLDSRRNLWNLAMLGVLAITIIGASLKVLDSIRQLF